MEKNSSSTEQTQQSEHACACGQAKAKPCHAGAENNTNATSFEADAALEQNSGDNANSSNTQSASTACGLDAELFPEGLKRCSLAKFIAWLLPALALIAWGGYAAFLVLSQGLGTTDLNDRFGFGLWITFDLAVIALGAGAFFSGLLYYILAIRPLKNIINLAVLIGFICYTGAMLVLVLDIGQPLRAWFGYWHANVHSMLTEVIFCITCYCLILSIETLPLIFEQKQLNKSPFRRVLAHKLHSIMPLFAAVGAFLSTFHQGSLGGMMGVLFARPFAFREGFFIWPWTFFLFILSAVASGPVFTSLVCTAMEKLSGKKLVSWDVKQLLGKISGIMLLVYLIAKFADTYIWIYDLMPREGIHFQDFFYGFAYGPWLLYAELGLCGLLPCLILLSPSLRAKPLFFYTAAILVCTGICINRYVLTVQTLAQRILPFDTWQVYVPNWVEWAPTALVVGYAILLLSLAYRYLPVFPQEKDLNS